MKKKQNFHLVPDVKIREQIQSKVLAQKTWLTIWTEIGKKTVSKSYTLCQQRKIQSMQSKQPLRSQSIYVKISIDSVVYRKQAPKFLHWRLWMSQALTATY